MRPPLRQAGIAVAVIAAFALLGFGASQLLGFSTPVSPQLAVEQRLLCPQCQGVRLDVCDRPVCDDLRTDIRRRLAAGESADSIVNTYEAAYGPAVLAAGAPASGSALVPGIFVLLGLLALGVLAVGRPRTRAEPEIFPAEPHPAVDSELAAWRRGR